jgi:hypothetical protein
MIRKLMQRLEAFMMGVVQARQMLLLQKQLGESEREC